MLVSMNWCTCLRAPIADAIFSEMFSTSRAHLCKPKDFVSSTLLINFPSISVLICSLCTSYQKRDPCYKFRFSYVKTPSYYFKADLAGVLKRYCCHGNATYEFILTAVEYLTCLLVQRITIVQGAVVRKVLRCVHISNTSHNKDAISCDFCRRSRS